MRHLQLRAQFVLLIRIWSRDSLRELTYLQLKLTSLHIGN
jgi:hypothetical protein